MTDHIGEPDTARSLTRRSFDLRFLALPTLLSGLTGCGLAVPDIKEPWDRTYPGAPADAQYPATPPIGGAGQIEYEIKRHVYCELAKAVQTANKYITTDSNGRRHAGMIPESWGAQTSLSLEVDENAALNPTVAFNTPILPSTFKFPNGVALPASQSSQSYSSGLGATLSSTASRTDKFDAYYTIKKLMTVSEADPKSTCNPLNPNADAFESEVVKFTPARSSLLITSELGLVAWLLGAMFTNKDIPSVQQPLKRLSPTLLEAKRIDLAQQGYSSAEITQIVAAEAGPGGAAKPSTPDTVSIEIKFVIVSSINATPTLRLVPLSATTGTTPLFGAGRTRTHDLIITIGPPGSATDSTHLASQIGNAVSNGNRQTTPGAQ